MGARVKIKVDLQQDPNKNLYNFNLSRKTMLDLNLKNKLLK